MESSPTQLTLLLHLILVPQPLMCVTLNLGCPVKTEKETVVDLIDWESGVELHQLVKVSYRIASAKFSRGLIFADFVGSNPTRKLSPRMKSVF